MRVLVTGGCGYLGQWLSKALLERGKLSTVQGEAEIEEIVLLDTMRQTKLLPELQENAKIKVIHGDIASADCLATMGTVDSVFHLASVVSGEGERDFDKALQVNLDGIRGVMETIRADETFSRFILASTVAVFGNLDDPSQPVGDYTKQVPQTTYGMTKSISEKLVNEYSRKGYVDGRSPRLPTVIVRAGQPNQAASSFCSSVFREPLAGKDAMLPVARNQPMPITSYYSAVQGIIAVHELPAERLGSDRAVGLPARNITAGDLLDCCDQLRSNRPGMGKVLEEINPEIASICSNWPQAVDNSRAEKLGIPMPPDLDAIVAEYIADFVDCD